jgi:titin
VIEVAAPVAPPVLTTIPLSGTLLRIVWADSSTAETGFRLERRRRLGDGTWTAFEQIAAPAANTRVFADSGLVAGMAYRYRIAACNAAGCSVWTTSPPIVMPVTPAAPAGVGATVVSPSRIRVTWTDASHNETGFPVLRRARGADGVWGPWVERGTARAGATAFADSVAAGGYQYRVRACNGPLCSSWITGTMVVMPTPPAPPTGPAVAALSATSAHVTWTDASGNETSFAVTRRIWSPEGGWQAWAVVGTVPANSTGFPNGGLLPGRTYEYRVAACAAGVVCSPFSSAVRVRLPAS